VTGIVTARCDYYHPDGTVASETRRQFGRDYVVGYEYDVSPRLTPS